jgi:hypothetical protein
MKTNQKSSDETPNRLAASRSEKKVEIPQGSADMCAAALFTD